MKRFITKIVGTALAVTMLFGSATVLAVSPDDNDYAKTNNATPISYGQTLHVEFTAAERGKWYSFTPDADGVYFIYSSVCQNDPYVYVYSDLSNRSQYLSNDDGGSGLNFAVTLTGAANHTYFIWCTNCGDPDPDSYDLTVSWPGNISQKIQVGGTKVGTASYTV
ncbi:MAG: hypothetical protein J5685_09225, partial [Clostridiales bacterium]|nr:hypothetical protein [Clostridiales bacterium]